MNNLVDSAMTKYEDLLSDEDKAVYIAANQLYDMIISSIEGLEVEYIERELYLWKNLQIHNRFF